MEAKCGLSRVTRDRLDTEPKDVDAVNFSLLAEDKGHRIRAVGVLSAVEHTFNETAMHAKSTGKQSSGRSKQSMSWSKSEGKGKSEENNGISKYSPKEPKRCDPRCQRHTQGQNIDNWSIKS